MPDGNFADIIAFPSIRKPEITYSSEYNKIFLYHPSYTRALANLAKGLGARWVESAQGWAFPPYIAYSNALEETFPKIAQTDEYLEWKYGNPLLYEDLIVPPNIKPTFDALYAYQKEAVSQLVHNPYNHPGTLLTLSPGLGKTVVALTTAGILELKKVLIVCPLSLMDVWQTEAAKWFGVLNNARLLFKLRSAYGERPPISDDENGWIVTNYGTVSSPRLAGDYCEIEWDLVILDESILIKNRHTQRFMNVKNLLGTAERKWLLSGSPISRHADDLWAQFHVIEPKAHPSYNRFRTRFCQVQKETWGTQTVTKVVGSSGRDFQADFHDVLFVRNQEEVLPDLPEMIFQSINVHMTAKQTSVYKRMLNEFLAQLDEGEELKATAKIAQLTRLQQITSNVCNLGDKWPDESGKHNVLLEMLEGEAIEFPLLVWTHWRPGAEELEEKIGALRKGLRVGRIGGSMSKEEVDSTFADYKAGELDVLILSLKVGKFGHTLTNTRTICYLDKTWFADDWVQSLYRVRRIGLTHTPRVITLTCPGTIDSMVEDNLAGKSIDIAAVTNASLSRMLRALNRDFLEMTG